MSVFMVGCDAAIEQLLELHSSLPWINSVLFLFVSHTGLSLLSLLYMTSVGARGLL